MSAPLPPEALNWAGAGYAFGLWTAWGALHSGLAARRVKAAFALALGPPRAALYPLGYTVVSLWTFWLVLKKAPDLPQVLWDAPLWLALALYALQAAGAALLVWAGFSLGGLKMLGLRQLADLLRGREPDAPDPERDFSRRGAYALVRHPMHAGGLFILACQPHQTLGGAVFALFGCLYMLGGTLLEERRLARDLGPAWAAYAREVPMFLPWPRSRPRSGPGDAAGR